MRLKTYSAESGYVYEYVFVGQEGADYRFDVSADRKAFRQVVIRIGRAALESAAQREMRAVEEYGVAKMSLFQAFDECSNPDSLAGLIEPSLESYAQILHTLDLL